MSIDLHYLQPKRQTLVFVTTKIQEQVFDEYWGTSIPDFETGLQHQGEHGIWDFMKKVCDLKCESVLAEKTYGMSSQVLITSHVFRKDELKYNLDH